MTEVSTELASISLVALFTVSLIGGLLPQALKSRLSDSRPFLRSADVFAAGILAAAAFVHLLPDATETLESFDNEYPIAGALALGGATAMYMLDLFAAPSNSGYVLAAALFMHALVEGFALGASGVKDNTYSTILFAILFHKAFGAFALSAALVGAGVQSRECTACALAFASITPVAALVALIFVRQALEEQNGKLFSASLTAVSAGIFVYIAFGELLQSKHSHSHQSNEEEEQLPLALPSVKNNNYGSSTPAPEKRSVRYSCLFCSRELLCACNSLSQKYGTETVSEKLCAVIFITSAVAMSVLAKWT